MAKTNLSIDDSELAKRTAEIIEAAEQIMAAIALTDTIVCSVTDVGCGMEQPYKLVAVQWHTLKAKIEGLHGEPYLTGWYVDATTSQCRVIDITNAIIRDMTTGELIYDGRK